jgi:hypothetical protein
MADLADFLIPIQVDQVDGEPHEEAVHRFTGDDPQALAGVQTIVFEQSCTALFAGVGEFGRIGQNGVASLVTHDDFHELLIARNGQAANRLRPCLGDEQGVEDRLVGRPILAAAGFSAGLDALESASAGRIARPT